MRKSRSCCWPWQSERMGIIRVIQQANLLPKWIPLATCNALHTCDELNPLSITNVLRPRASCTHSGPWRRCRCRQEWGYLHVFGHHDAYWHFPCCQAKLCYRQLSMWNNFSDSRSNRRRCDWPSCAADEAPKGPRSCASAIMAATR